MDAELIRGYLEFYQDLGIKTLYRREAGGTACPTTDQQEAIMGETLPQILADIGDCRRCRLHEGRNKLVFGVGERGEGAVGAVDGQGELVVVFENAGRERGSCVAGLLYDC